MIIIVISIDLETNAHIFQHRNSHHERNNTMHKNVFNDDNNISDEDELDLTKIKLCNFYLYLNHPGTYMCTYTGEKMIKMQMKIQDIHH